MRRTTWRSRACRSAANGRTTSSSTTHTTAFGYFGTFSTAFGVPPAGDPLYANPELKTRLGILVGCGFQDTIFSSTRDLHDRLMAAGIPFVNDNQNGGHTWWIWRIMLRDFVGSVAFRATTTDLVANVRRRKLTATVVPATRQPATPTGTVRFLADGKPLGRPVRLRRGKATLSGRRGSKPWWRAPGTTVSAVYSGDALYNTSTSAGVTVTLRQRIAASPQIWEASTQPAFEAAP